MSRRAVRSLALLLAATAALGLPARAAPPALPATIPYQGLLLDGGGAPQTGTVDLTLRLYDALTGGTLLYKQALPAVPLADGVFSVTLGPSGAATDSPANPLTTSLSEALAGDLAATGPSRFLEVTVGTVGPLARTQIVSVPYALHAGSADTAASADVAATAGDVSTVNGVPAAVLSEIFEHVDFDGGVPPNDSPLEGVADPDGDGVANFLDPDNDGDALSDVAEVGAGSNVNLVTPAVSGVSPLPLISFLTTTVTVSGQNFLPGLSVAYGSQTPIPTGVTPTSFQVAVGPQGAGPANVVVTLPNGESDSFTGAYFFDFSGVSHGLSVPAGAQLSLDLGTGFLPVVGGFGQFARDFDNDGDFDLGGLPGAGATVAGFAPGDVLAGVRCRVTSSFNCLLELVRDLDGDGILGEPAERTTIESLASSPTAPLVHALSFAFDLTGRPAVGYVKVGTSRTVTVSRDANGDGDFADAGEVSNLSLVGSSQGDGGDLALDAAGRVAYAYFEPSAAILRVAHDRNGDGDFSDTIGGNPETRTVTTGPVTCFGASFDDGARLALVWNAGAGTQLGRDANTDGDFADAGEVVTLAPGPALGCDVDGAAAGGLAVAHDGDDLRLLLDRDDDGSFTAPGEDQSLAPTGSGTHPVRVRQRGTTAAVATGTSFYFDPLLGP